MIQSSLTKSIRVRSARNLSSNTGFEQQLKCIFFQSGFDKTVMESSLPAFQVLGQARDGLHWSRETNLERFDQEGPKAWFSLTQTGAIECPTQLYGTSLVHRASHSRLVRSVRRVAFQSVAPISGSAGIGFVL